MYKRLLGEKIKNDFFQGKIIILAGARQVGKTTLCNEILAGFKDKYKIKIFNGDYFEDNDRLSKNSLEYLKNLVEDFDVIFIDEGQKIKTIGTTLKILVDHYGKDKQIIVTGSSSFNLLDNTEEYLTGRKFVHYMYPISFEEMNPNKDYMFLLNNLDNILKYGSYPEVASMTNMSDKERKLKEIVSSYLYKDIFELDNVKKSSVLLNLVKALAFQIGSEVSYNELANTLGINRRTVENYIDLLEKNYIIFRLHPYFPNKRREIKRPKKIYFHDVGIRNAIIGNFNDIIPRNDAGALWENFLISERIKYQEYHNIYCSNFFWRTRDGAEVDFVEERDGKMYGYEMKMGDNNKKPPASWLEYKNSEYKVINKENLKGFII